MVFTSFLEMIEDKHGYSMVDEILSSSNLNSEGIYTSVGNYSFEEMKYLLTQYSELSGLAASSILEDFGKSIHYVFLTNYPHYYEQAGDAFSLLEGVEKHIHVTVHKVYPDSNLPKFVTQRIGDDTLEIVYSSQRKMGDFAHGLIQATLKHYGQTGEISSELMHDDGSKVKFTIKLTSN